MWSSNRYFWGNDDFRFNILTSLLYIFMQITLEVNGYVSSVDGPQAAKLEVVAF